MSTGIVKTNFESKITVRILVTLILARALYALVFLTGNESIFLESIYSFLTYGLISTVIFLNSSYLHLFNLDRLSMILFVFLGGFYSFFVSQPIGTIMTVVAILNLNMLLTNELSFSRIQNGMIAFFIGVFFVFAELSYWGWLGAIFPKNIVDADIISAAFRANFTLVLFEEIIFRGILWIFLENRGLKKYQVVFAQALLFWVIHFNQYAQRTSFWLYLPFASILFGIVVLKSKSIFPSFVLHYLHNFVFALLLAP